ncbi:SycD/LcrH family type III secretion system chaperone [Estrella lausannensis]|uniref:Putative type III secretion chaperone SycD/LcrH n=1 Tax=Estrella lausannensis TaxID=483423 RepID=A0A0H5DN98_9BACT|nr:SycD/LcrH family type III secretion system chaperone [Estrella lausannensis]CRX37761.1 Putative type III secretion chaperone SycD/LcrH [Estrella lausannensis]
MAKVEEIIQVIIQDAGITIDPETLKERTEFLREYLQVFEDAEPKDLFPSIAETEKMIDDLVTKNGGNLSAKEIEEQKKVMKKIFIDGKAPAEAMGIDAKTTEMIYSEAGRLYNAGRYQDALGFFRVLDLIMPNVPKFMFGIAACYQMLKKNSEAAGWYIKCSYFDKESPIPYYHMSDCFLKLKNYGAALAALRMVLQRAKGDPKFEKICGKCKLMMEDAKKRLNETPPEGAKKEAGQE